MTHKQRIEELANLARKAAELSRQGVARPDCLLDLRGVAGGVWSAICTHCQTEDRPDGGHRTTCRMLTPRELGDLPQGDRDTADRARAVADLCDRAERDGLTADDAARLDAVAEALAPAGTLTVSRSWRDAQKTLDTIRANREPFTTFDRMAARLGCSVGLVHKAITPKPEHLQALTPDDRRTTKTTAARLKAWQTAGKPTKAARRESDLNEAALARLTAEAAPDADAILDDDGATWQRLLDEATADERARLHTMDDAERRRLVALTIESEADRRHGHTARPR